MQEALFDSFLADQKRRGPTDWIVMGASDGDVGARLLPQGGDALV